MLILFCRTNQENVLQKEIKDWAFEVPLLTGEPSQVLIPADWVIENDLCQIICLLSAINVTCSKSLRINENVQSWFAQSNQYDYQFWTAQSQQNDQFENLYISIHEKAKNIKFGQQIQRVLSGNSLQEVLKSLPHIHVTLTNLFIL